MTVEEKQGDVASKTEDTTKVDAEQEPSHPESVPWSQYVGLKEKFNKTETRFKEQVQSLEEQLSKAVKQEDFESTKAELDKVKTDYQKAQEDLKGVKDKGIEAKRGQLKSRGIAEDKYVNVSEEALDAMLTVLDSYKPKPDLGTGGGSGDLRGSPMELARQAYSEKKS